ncbi:hypothetical protein EJ02DRAFT_38419 [Clathrospora elynae]|uniref:RING-type domain-containing protein n=1 Tax=Clathrospora elynae TaxID=706981 RepID=A0A6A5SHP9_9PLEO|nr:hypothetical protein EJ02DRAFT_38419 [Clathrospora elynae]
MKPPTSSINLLVCKRREHLQIPGAVECYGTGCSICTLEGSFSHERVYLSCGHPFCKCHITKWFDEKGKRTCPTCRSDVPEEDAHFKKDGTYALGWPPQLFMIEFGYERH